MKSAISSVKLMIAAVIILLISCHKEELATGSVKDFEGNTYTTVKIGNNVWMSENLKSTKYNDGTDIPLIEDSFTWQTLLSDGYSWYNNDIGFRKDYGALYNAYSVASGKLCPTGWHIPDYEELQELKNYSEDTLTVGGNLKEPGSLHWSDPNLGASNKSGFRAVGAGIRFLEGSFSSLSYFTCFWSSTELNSEEQWCLSLYYDDALAKIDHEDKNYGFSIRCVRDK